MGKHHARAECDARSRIISTHDRGHIVAAGEQAAIDMLPTVRERVMDSEDAKEGIQSFIERRQAVFTGR